MSVDRIVEMARLAGRLNDPKLRAQLRRLQLVPDRTLEELLLRQLTVAAGDQSFDPSAFNRISESDLTIPGTERIPYVEWGRLVTLHSGLAVAGTAFRFPLVTGHRLVAGSTRSGKSTAVATMLKRIPAATKCWIIDPEDDPVYKNLACAAGFMIIDCSDFRRNILEPPPGCPPEVWFGHFKRNVRESCFLRDGGISMLTVLLEHCRKERECVALRDVYQKLIDLRYRLIQAGREYSFYESLKNRLEGLLVNPMFDCVKGFDLARLASENVLFLCGSLSSDLYPLFVNDVLQWLGCHFAPTLDPVPKLVVVLEEVHRMTNAQRLRRADIAEPIVLDAFRVLAKRQVSLVCVDQVCSELPAQILANCSFRAVFSTIEGRDLDALQRSLGLTHEQRLFVSRLPQRMCVVQYANPAFPEPFPVAIDEFEMKGDIADEVTRRRAETLASLSYVPFDAQKVAPASKQHLKRADPLLSKPALDYFVEVCKNQFTAASKRDQQLGVPLSQGNAVRRELADAGLVTLEAVSTFGRARRIVNTAVTEKGYELLKAMKIPHDRPRGRGGWEHKYHQHAVAAWAERNGYRASIEQTANGKSVDVLLENERGRVGVEILCVGMEKELANLRDLHSGCSEVWFCVRDRAEAGKLRALIELKFGEEAKAILSRVKFRLLGEFQVETGDTAPSA